MRGIIKYVLLTATRDWLFLGLFFMIIIASGLSIFLGSNALSEQHLMQLAYISGSTRMILVIGMILFICFHIRRSFDNREIEFIISRPISRVSFIVAYFIAFSLLALLIAIPVSIFIGVIFRPSFTGLALWSISLYFELIMISAFSILAALILRSAVSAVMGCLAFYIISRMMGFAVASIILPGSISGINFTKFLELILKFFSLFLPRLDQFAKSKWLVYGTVEPEIINLVLIQSAIYISLILLMAIFDFQRKQF